MPKCMLSRSRAVVDIVEGKAELLGDHLLIAKPVFDCGTSTVCFRVHKDQATARRRRYASALVQARAEYIVRSVDACIWTDHEGFHNAHLLSPNGSFGLTSAKLQVKLEDYKGHGYLGVDCSSNFVQIITRPSNSVSGVQLAGCLC